ncbi:MAG: potassium channel family protein [Phycisphaerae bacterium]|nr:potassium channel family protein [Phycisphaerae bacterium]
MALEQNKKTIPAEQILTALASGEDILLTQCRVTGVLDINSIIEEPLRFGAGALNINNTESGKVVTLGQSLVFDKCQFDDNVIFCAPWTEPDSVTVVFEKDAVFNSSEFLAQARFRNAQFKGAASFDGCTFGGVVTFKNATICGDAKFRTTEFKGYSLWGSVTFKSSARFVNSHFVRGANFSGVKFLGEVDFNGVYASSRAVPVTDEITFGRKTFGEDESFWRFVKQSAQEAGHYQLAGQYFYNERCAALWKKFRGDGYDNLSSLRKIMRFARGLMLLPEFILGKLLFGYGEKPWRVLAASILVIIVCGFFYAQPHTLHRYGEDTGASFFQGLYFSTVTFTTLGYGDLSPSPEGFCRKLAMCEALSGGFLMALFVVCLAKRYSRG